jgi:hypothetical protein
LSQAVSRRRVRLFSRGGHDWSRRFPWIAETARKIRKSQFIIDGEAVVLGADCISDFNAHSQHDEPEREVAFAADEHDEQDEQATARPILMAWRCGSMIGLPLIRTSSLKKAMTEPVR